MFRIFRGNYYRKVYTYRSSRLSHPLPTIGGSLSETGWIPTSQRRRRLLALQLEGLESLDLLQSPKRSSTVVGVTPSVFGSRQPFSVKPLHSALSSE